MVFFTGENAAKHICRAAAQQLSPVCMELGGKNPVYITKNANLDTAVLKLAYNKFLNAGQFCVSPDHVYLDLVLTRPILSVKDAKRTLATTRKKRPTSRVLSTLGTMRDWWSTRCQHHGRNILAGCFVEVGEDPDEGDLYIPPTIILNPTNSKCMLLTEKCLARFCHNSVRRSRYGPPQRSCYSQSLGTAFTADDAEVQHILSSSRSGGVCVNDCITHMLAENFPFGGRPSGYGNYRGEWGFRTRTNALSWSLTLPILTEEDPSQGIKR